MQVTILGSGAAFPRAGAACAGLLVQTQTTSVWLDAGNGTFARLQEFMDYLDLDAVVLSHHHQDHIADMAPLLYALAYDESEPHQMNVWAPDDVRPILRHPLGHSKKMFDRVFDFHDIDGDQFEIGDLKFAPFKTVHPAPTYGFRVTNGSGPAFVYTADTAAFDDLADSCSDAGLLIADSCYTSNVSAPNGLHMWASEAGELARQADVDRLVITHVWGSCSIEQAVTEASEAWGQPCIHASECVTHTV